MKFSSTFKRGDNKRMSKFINMIGCLIAKWILRNGDGLVIRRRGGAEQIIKVFAVPAYENIIKPRIVPVEPEYVGADVLVGYKFGKCRCGNVVRSYQNFCDACGARLAWRSYMKPAQETKR